MRVLDAMSTAGFSRLSRRGWYVAEHPLLGQLSWKSGRDFRTAGRYFLLRLNGRLVLDAWPDARGSYPGFTDAVGWASIPLWEREA